MILQALLLLLALAALPPLAASLYLLVLTLLSRKPAEPPPAAQPLRFDLIVPAHDEEAGIGATVASLLALDHPREQFRVVVVADNCSDATAARAQEAGAQVLVRNDTSLRGKGYALALAFARSLEGDADAVVVVDADTLVSANLLRAFASRLAQGAQAVQADYGVRNAMASWRTRLILLAFTLFHVVRSRGRARLGVSCGLRGNGMCFSRALLQAVPYDSFSLVEDVEYGLRLGERGIRVEYADEAHVYGEMVSGGAAARSQRQRWEGGRRALARERALPLLREGLLRRSPLLVDLALDLIIPPLAQLTLWLLAGALLSGLLAALAHRIPTSLWLFCAGLGSVAVYIVRGLTLSGAGLRGLLDLAFAPLYIVWKLFVSVRGAAHRGWVRTARESGPP